MRFLPSLWKREDVAVHALGRFAHLAAADAAAARRDFYVT